MISSLLLFIRFLAFFQVLPGIGAQIVPFTVRLLLSFFVTAILSPFYPVKTPLHLASLLTYSVINLVIGLLLGYVIHLFLDLAATLGEILDLQLGFSMVTLFNPSVQGASAVITGLMVNFAVVEFFLLGGDRLSVETLVLSLHYLPLMPAPFANFGAATSIMVNLTGRVLLVAFMLSQPVLLFLFLLNVTLAFASRLMPQLNVFFLGMGLQPLIGIISLLAGLTGYTLIMRVFLHDLIRAAALLVQRLA